MKKVLWLVAVLAAWILVLSGCNKTENVNEENVGETPVVETAQKQSLDLGELIGLIENHFPKSYEYSVFNMTDNLIEDEWRHVYNRMELGYLTPEYSNIIDREVTSSGIEDGMIYTMVKSTLDDDRQIDVLYIVNPETLDFVAASVEDGDITTNYQFSYDNIESLTYEDLEEIAEMNFPTSSSYTIVDLATEQTTNKENLYHEDTLHKLVNITPDFAPIKEHTLLSSAIEDGMIYTNFDVVYDNDTTGNVLYINDPETLNFIAATVESEGMSVNYQFAY